MNLPAQTVKFLLKLFSKSLQGIKGGGAPFCAAPRAQNARSAQCAASKKPCQPKTAKRIFGGPGSHGPSGQAKERTRILPVRRGSFCPARRAIWQAGRFSRSLPLSGLLAFVLGVSAFFLSVFRCLVPGLWVVRRFLFGLRCLLAVWPSSALFPACRQPAAFVQTFAPVARLPAVRFVCAHFRLFFAFSCLTFASQISFHLSLRPRRASTFFRKESRQRFAKGLRPFEPHSCALRLIFFSSSALLAGLRGPSAANRRQIRETLEKPRSRAQLFKRFCAKGDACALWLISPFLSLLAGLVRPFRPQTAGWRGKRPKSQRSKAQLFGRFCAWGMRRGFRPAGFLPAAENRN